jgi:hypothetical protein
LEEETGETPRETTDLLQVTGKLYHIWTWRVAAQGVRQTRAFRIKWYFFFIYFSCTLLQNESTSMLKYFFNKVKSEICAWNYQKGYQRPLIEEGQAIQWTNEKYINCNQLNMICRKDTWLIMIKIPHEHE